MAGKDDLSHREDDFEAELISSLIVDVL